MQYLHQVDLIHILPALGARIIVRDCLRAAFRMGFLDLHETRWLKMVEDRNRTSHTYDEETAEEIYRSLSGYAELFESLLERLLERERRRLSEEQPEEGSKPPQ